MSASDSERPDEAPQQCPQHYECEVTRAGAGERLDVWLTRQPFAPSRAYAQRLIADGRVRLIQYDAARRGKTSEPTYVRAPARHRVAAGERFAIEVPPPERVEPYPEAIPLHIVYEDDDMAVVDKPRGMVVHAGAGHHAGTLVNALLAHGDELSTIGGEIRPGIVHRLDKETTGLLVVAKHDAAHLSLARQIRERSLSRRYLALVRGDFPRDRGHIQANVGRHPVHRKRMAVLHDGGRSATTHFAVLERLRGYTLLELALETGRTHQIRVHMAHVGFPVVGDPVYGVGSRKARRTSAQSADERKPKGPLGLAAQALHAWRLGLNQPTSGEWMEFVTPPPADFLAALATLGSEQADALSQAGTRGKTNSH